MIRKTAIAICVLSLAYIGASVALAQTGGGSAWTQIGTLPPSATMLALDPTRSAAAYVLGKDGISRTTDAGATWNLCGSDAREMSVAGNPATIYSMGPKGLRQSPDGCDSWKDVPAQGVQPSSANVRWLAPYPNNSLILYAGMDGLGGVYRSTDSGGTWAPAASGLPAGGWVSAFTADARYPERVIVGLKYNARQHSPAYVYKSIDGGLTWRSSSLGLHMLPNNGGEITGLAWSGNDLFAATATDGLYKSADRGESWKQATMPRETAQQPTARLTRLSALAPTPAPLGIKALTASMDGLLVLNTPEGAYSSTDGGNSWQGFGPANEGNPGLVALEPYTGRVMSGNGGKLWSYQVPSGTVAQQPAEPTATTDTEPTPPPPPVAPTATATAVPPTAVPVKPTATPTAPPPVRPSGWLPTDPAKPLDPAISDFFEQTKHNIKYGFRDYWHNNGEVAAFGYPITEEFEENGVDVQYFERARLEYRDGKIVLGLLGTELTAGKFFQTVRFFPSEDTRVYFGPTQHSVSGPFLTFWRDNGGLETFGYPLSESVQDDGSEYQWFERARLEWHPWLAEGRRIVLGSIGTEALKKRGWLK